MEVKEGKLVGRGLLMINSGKPRDVGSVTSLLFGREKIRSLIGKLSVGFTIELNPIRREESGDNATDSVVTNTGRVGGNCDTGTVGVSSPGREARLPLPNS